MAAHAAIDTAGRSGPGAAPGPDLHPHLDVVLEPHLDLAPDLGPDLDPEPEPPDVMPALRRAAIPLREPQAARSITAPAPGPGFVPATQGTLALALPWDEPVTFPPSLPGPHALHDDRGPGDRAELPAGDTGGSAGPGGVLPEPREWAATFVQAAMEVATGLRPPAQLVRWAAPDVHAALSRRGALTNRARRPGRQSPKPRLRTLVLGTPAARICEVAAVMAEPDRIRAVAFRMEGFQGRWRVTALEIG